MHAAAVGTPLPRRGPAPKRRSRYPAPALSGQELPGSELAALAEFLRGRMENGALVRRLHSTQPKRRLTCPRRQLETRKPSCGNLPAHQPGTDEHQSAAGLARALAADPVAYQSVAYSPGVICSLGERP